MKGYRPGLFLKIIYFYSMQGYWIFRYFGYFREKMFRNNNLDYIFFTLATLMSFYERNLMFSTMCIQSFFWIIITLDRNKNTFLGIAKRLLLNHTSITMKIIMTYSNICIDNPFLFTIEYMTKIETIVMYFETMFVNIIRIWKHWSLFHIKRW